MISIHRGTTVLFSWFVVLDCAVLQNRDLGSTHDVPYAALLRLFFLFNSLSSISHSPPLPPPLVFSFVFCSHQPAYIQRMHGVYKCNMRCMVWWFFVGVVVQASLCRYIGLSVADVVGDRWIMQFISRCSFALSISLGLRSPFLPFFLFVFLFCIHEPTIMFRIILLLGLAILSVSLPYLSVVICSAFEGWKW